PERVKAMYTLRKYDNNTHTTLLTGELRDCCRHLVTIADQDFPNKTIRQLMDEGYRIEPSRMVILAYEDVTKDMWLNAHSSFATRKVFIDQFLGGGHAYSFL